MSDSNKLKITKVNKMWSGDSWWPEIKNSNRLNKITNNDTQKHDYGSNPQNIIE